MRDVTGHLGAVVGMFEIAAQFELLASGIEVDVVVDAIQAVFGGVALFEERVAACFDVEHLEVAGAAVIVLEAVPANLSAPEKAVQASVEPEAASSVDAEPAPHVAVEAVYHYEVIVFPA